MVGHGAGALSRESNLSIRRDEADDAFKRVSGFSALAECSRKRGIRKFQRTEFAQPANLLIQIGLLAVLRSRGIEPAACVGHL